MFADVEGGWPSRVCELFMICLRVQQTAADPEEWQQLTALKLADQLLLIIDHLVGNFEVECSSALQIHLKTENIKYYE
ncbi:hypothetical protein D917_05690 [Trichinella nativa]|uniref:Uncharacterized protein n=1 Tax=Trichinella nativa TaxID=6335 RepID=A0A1Y3F1D5_9BILA|nr:hypothetical protein D917_05690 [Trichinella nativa]